jgi:hypothetical protein
MIDGTEYVIVRLGSFVFVPDENDMVNGGFNERVSCLVTGFNPDDVDFGFAKLKVVAAVRYDSTSGNQGHYYTYVRVGESSWRECNDRRGTENVKFVPQLRNVSYMIMKKIDD